MSCFCMPVTTDAGLPINIKLSNKFRTITGNTALSTLECRLILDKNNFRFRKLFFYFVFNLGKGINKKVSGSFTFIGPAPKTAPNLSFSQPVNQQDAGLIHYLSIVTIRMR